MLMNCIEMLMNRVEMLMNRIEMLMNMTKMKVITMTTSETLSWSKSTCVKIDISDTSNGNVAVYS